ncbi:PRTRC system ThiF family protein [Deinococcus sonorensis]|uniref:PRTRC system ThiF family protein n=1 Tax=Deinococcus sonorensis TaxID=309891 RepID=A0ABV8YB49_9DEIO
MWLNRSDIPNRRRPVRLSMIGCGGSGSMMLSHLTHLHLALQAHGYPGLHVTVFDPGLVREANRVRQRFLPSEVGLNKAECLVHRINLTMGLGWAAVPERFTTHWANAVPADVVVTCLDTRSGRRAVYRAYTTSLYRHTRFWLDLGNGRTTGQCLLGQPHNRWHLRRHALPDIAALMPDLLDTTLPDDDVKSCSALEALESQGLYINTTLSALAAELLHQLLIERKLTHHGAYLNLQTLSVNGVPVPHPTQRAG